MSGATSKVNVLITLQSNALKMDLPRILLIHVLHILLIDPIIQPEANQIVLIIMKMLPCRDELVTGLRIIEQGRLDILKQRPAHLYPLHEIRWNLLVWFVAIKVGQYWIVHAVDDMLRTTEKLGEFI